MASFIDRPDRESLEKVSDIYDHFYPVVAERCRKPDVYTKLIEIIRPFMAKNERMLLTNIVGRQVLLNEKMEIDIYDLFNLDKKEIKSVISNSEYFKKMFGGSFALMDQFCFAVPLIFASLEYKRLKKQENSDFCYLLAFFKPYASRVSLYWKYGVDEDQMQYTVEHLSDRFDLKRIGNIMSVLQNKAAVSYQNYIAPIKAGEKMTDRNFDIIYKSGIASRVNDFLGTIMEEYSKNKGKSLEFEDSMKSVKDQDTDESDVDDNDIASDAAVKNKIVNKIVLSVIKDPVDKGLEAIACQLSFYGAYDKQVVLLDNLLQDIINTMFDKLNEFFSTLIGSFLYSINPATKERYTMGDFSSMEFVKVGVDILTGKKSHLGKDTEMYKCREIFQEMLTHSTQYVELYGESYKRYTQHALASYWVYFIQQRAKGGK